ncbi:MAG: acyl carrier protein [Vicinamibacterales bacterium]
MTATSPLAVVVDLMTEIITRKGGQAPPLASTTPLDGALGLDSLDFAEVVVRLEQRFGFDPFAGAAIERLQTLGDLAALYAR